MKMKGVTFEVPKILFGCGMVKHVGKEAKTFGNKALLVTGKTAMKKTGITDRVKTYLKKEGVKSVVFDKVEQDPSVETIDEGVKLARNKRCQFIIGLGGGGAMDAAKIISGVVTNGGSAGDYHKGRKFTKPPLPLIQITTTSGTGSEITPNGVITNKKLKLKRSIGDPLLRAKVAIVDPELTVSAPPTVTAYAGMDALTQAIECYICTVANPITDALSFKAIQIIAKSLEKAFTNGDDIEARTDMAMGSMLTAMAFGNAGLGTVHGLAHPIGFLFHVPHGMICGLLLPFVMRFNLAAAKDKLAEVAAACGLDTKGLSTQQAAEAGIKFVEDLKRAVGIPERLKDIGVTKESFDEILKGMEFGCNETNPQRTTNENLRELLTNAL